MEEGLSASASAMSRLPERPRKVLASHSLAEMFCVTQVNPSGGCATHCEHREREWKWCINYYETAPRNKCGLPWKRGQ